jgi:hypothetical protein
MDNSRRRPAPAEARPAQACAPPRRSGRQRAAVEIGARGRYARSSLIVMAALMLVPAAPADANNCTHLGGTPANVAIRVVAGARG